MLAEVVIEVIIQAAPTAWMRPPKFEARLAIHISRNVAFLKGARGEARFPAASSIMSCRQCAWRFASFSDLAA
jgi:hypothetical protein